jgi:flagellar assembly protein FliH
MKTKIISAGTAAVDRWTAPAVESSVADELKGARGGAAHLLTARQLDELQRQVQQEAHERGFAQGLAEGQQEARRRAERLAALLDALGFPFRELDQAVDEELAKLAVALASQLARREIAGDADFLRRTVRECLGILPVGTRHITVYLNPADADLLVASLPEGPAHDWRLERDAALERGDLRVVSASSQVDGQLESRLAAIIATALAAAPETR